MSSTLTNPTHWADRRTARPTVRLYAGYEHRRWTGTTTVTLVDGGAPAIAVDDLAMALVAGGCTVVDRHMYPGGEVLEVAPSPQVHDVVMEMASIEVDDVYARGGHLGAVVPWADPAAVRCEDRLLGRDTTALDLAAYEREVLAWWESGDRGPMPQPPELGVAA